MDDADIFRNEDSYFWSIRRGRFTRWTQQVSLTFGTCMKLKYMMIDKVPINPLSFGRVYSLHFLLFVGKLWRVGWLSSSARFLPHLPRVSADWKHPCIEKTWSYVGWGVFTYWWDNDLRSRKSSLSVRFVSLKAYQTQNTAERFKIPWDRIITGKLSRQQSFIFRHIVHKTVERQCAK